MNHDRRNALSQKWRQVGATKTTRTALQNASSVATLLLTSDVLIAEAPKKEKKAGGGHGHGGMDDMY